MPREFLNMLSGMKDPMRVAHVYRPAVETAEHSKSERKRIFLSAPHMSGREMEYVKHAFETNWISTLGANLRSLEKRFSGLVGRPALPVASGTAGIHLGLKLLGVQPDDEVVVPTLTFIASVNPILYERATPVFIDSERESWNLDPGLLNDFLKKRAARGGLPKALIVVHLFGQSADMDPIMDICRMYEIPVLEDAAEALGARYKGRQPGVFGDVGVFSFNGNKIITSSSGGIMVSPHKEWIEKARYWSNQAREHDEIHNYVHSEVGYNYRLSNVTAGIALGQLEVLDERVARRREIAFRYAEAFEDIPGLELMPQAPYGLHTNWLSCFLIDEEKFGLSQSDLILILKSENIESRPVWKPMHTQKLFERCECIGGAVAEDLNQRGICLPSSSNLTEEEQEFVIDVIRQSHISAREDRAVLTNTLEG